MPAPEALWSFLEREGRSFLPSFPAPCGE
jgi:hypothetical protein